jgi:hypothetical protein
MVVLAAAFSTAPAVHAQPASAPPASAPPASAQPDPKEAGKPAEKRAVHKRKHDPARVKAALKRKGALQLADSRKVISGLKYLSKKQQTDGRSFIEYDSYVLEAKAVGDLIEIYIPEIGMTLHGKIEVVETNEDIVRWAGHFEEFDATRNSFSISQTLEDDYTIGTFETPIKSFSMEVKKGLGWIVNHTSDSSQPGGPKDYAEAPPPHH